LVVGNFSYQELFVTPVTSPSNASFRKQSRHILNFRMNPRGRPHNLQRFRSRILYLGDFSSFAIFAVVAIHFSSSPSAVALGADA
jgi:hypothetical protein